MQRNPIIKFSPTKQINTAQKNLVKNFNEIDHRKMGSFTSLSNNIRFSPHFISTENIEKNQITTNQMSKPVLKIEEVKVTSNKQENQVNIKFREEKKSAAKIIDNGAINPIKRENYFPQRSHFFVSSIRQQETNFNYHSQKTHQFISPCQQASNNIKLKTQQIVSPSSKKILSPKLTMCHSAMISSSHSSQIVKNQNYCFPQNSCLKNPGTFFKQQNIKNFKKQQKDGNIFLINSPCRSKLKISDQISTLPSSKKTSKVENEFQSLNSPKKMPQSLSSMARCNLKGSVLQSGLTKSYKIKNGTDILKSSNNHSTLLKVKSEKQSNILKASTPQTSRMPYFFKNKISKPSCQISFNNPQTLANSIIMGTPNLLSQESKQNLKQLSIDDFQIIQKIGKGSFGDVYLAREKHCKFLFVLKSLSKKKIKQEKLEEHVLRQIKIQSFLQHKHITSLYGFFDDEEKIYLIMQYMHDGSLLDNKKKRSEKEVGQLLKQVCLALTYMHQQKVLHRDIKPQNIFMFENYLKIGDFGCSVSNDALRSTLVGCLAYISPEQYLQKAYDAKIDVWSVGILAYELLLGRPPFQSNLRDENVQLKFPEIFFQKNTTISNQAQDFLICLLKEEPKERPTIKQILKHKFLSTKQSI